MADEKGIQGIFGNIGKLLELAQELQKNGSSQQQFETKSGMNGVFGVNIRTMNGAARVEPFGNVRSTPSGASVDAVREPLTDVLEEETGYTIIVELPGVDANTVRVDASPQSIRVEASGTAGRKYEKNIELSKAIVPEGLKRTYLNGILELSAVFAD